MLRAVTDWAGDRYDTVSVLARNPHDVEDLFADKSSHFNPIACDYAHVGAMEAGVEAAQGLYGDVDLAVCWFHPLQPAIALGRQLSAHPCRYIHIAGSASVDPDGRFHERSEPLRKLPLLEYQLVILGFMIEKESSRWLTNPEIAGGVIEAIETGNPKLIVGRGEPWDSRP